jgi:hypothetical protein
MNETVHFHLRHVCIDAQKTMTQNTAQHYWGKYMKKRTRTIRMSSEFLQKLGMMGRISTYLLKEEPR